MIIRNILGQLIIYSSWSKETDFHILFVYLFVYIGSLYPFFTIFILKDLSGKEKEMLENEMKEKLGNRDAGLAKATKAKSDFKI